MVLVDEATRNVGAPDDPTVIGVAVDPRTSEDGIEDGGELGIPIQVQTAASSVANGNVGRPGRAPQGPRGWATGRAGLRD